MYVCMYLYVYNLIVKMGKKDLNLNKFVENTKVDSRVIILLTI